MLKLKNFRLSLDFWLQQAYSEHSRLQRLKWYGSPLIVVADCSQHYFISQASDNVLTERRRQPPIVGQVWQQARISIFEMFLSLLCLLTARPA
jgi:hypothetical protein